MGCTRGARARWRDSSLSNHRTAIGKGECSSRHDLSFGVDLNRRHQTRPRGSRSSHQVAPPLRTLQEIPPPELHFHLELSARFFLPDLTMMPKFLESVAARYTSIGDEKYMSDEPVSTSSESEDGHVNWEFRRTNSSRRWWVLGVLWISSIALAVFATVMITAKSQSRDPLGTLASGFTSDFGESTSCNRLRKYVMTRH